MRYAWVKEKIIIDICEGNPSELFHEEIAIHFSTEIADGVKVGANWNGSAWINPEIIIQEPTPIIENKIVSPIEFKLLFTVHERIAIKNSADEIIQDFMSLVNDPKLTKVDLGLQSTKDALSYMTNIKLIGPSRVAEILNGQFQ